MTGANCYSQDYSFLEQQLAGRGYLVAIIDELHPVTPDTQAFISRTHLLGTQHTVSNACPSCCAMCCQSGSSARPFCQKNWKTVTAQFRNGHMSWHHDHAYGAFACHKSCSNHCDCSVMSRYLAGVHNAHKRRLKLTVCHAPTLLLRCRITITC